VKALNLKEFKELLAIIEKDHWLVTGRCVKYVDSSFDFRTKEFWRIVIRPFGTEKVFTTTNRFGEDAPKHDTLFEEIKEWLNVTGTTERET